MDFGVRINRKNFVRGCALLLLLAGGSCAILLSQFRPKQIIGSLLRLESVPVSIRNADCESWGVTDVLTNCYFEIDPAEFPALLKGWAFRETPADGDGYPFDGGPKVGPDFPVAAAFFVQNPSEFPEGGLVTLAADDARSRIKLYYYEE